MMYIYTYTYVYLYIYTFIYLYTNRSVLEWDEQGHFIMICGEKISVIHDKYIG